MRYALLIVYMMLMLVDLVLRPLLLFLISVKVGVLWEHVE
jgi:hypothetical protein